LGNKRWRLLGAGQCHGWKHIKQEDHQSVANQLTTDSARSYELKIEDRHSVVADPLLTDDAAYLGHLANDAAIVG